LNVYKKLQRAAANGERTWSLINKYRGETIIDALYHVATTLESHTNNLVSPADLQIHQQENNNTFGLNPTKSVKQLLHYEALKAFYNLPTLTISRKHKAKPLYRQIVNKPQQFVPTKFSNSRYQLLENYTTDKMSTTNTQDSTQNMEEEPQTYAFKVSAQPHAIKPKLTKKWETDLTIPQLSTAFLTNLRVEQEKLQEAGEDMEEALQYKAPTDEAEISQQLKYRLSLRKTRNSESQPTLQLFKSFAQALRASDPSVLIIPVNAKKQNLPSLSSAAKILAMDNNKVLTYFKTYYPSQRTNLSGYINILRNLSLQNYLTLPLYTNG
jgi:hypothetical protein